MCERDCFHKLSFPNIRFKPRSHSTRGDFFRERNTFLLPFSAFVTQQPLPFRRSLSPSKDYVSPATITFPSMLPLLGILNSPRSSFDETNAPDTPPFSYHLLSEEIFFLRGCRIGLPLPASSPIFPSQASFYVALLKKILLGRNRFPFWPLFKEF